MSKIRIVNGKRPTSGQGSASPRFELRTVCCDMWLASDSTVATLEAVAERGQHRNKLDKLVIVDLGAPIEGW